MPQFDLFIIRRPIHHLNTTFSVQTLENNNFLQYLVLTFKTLQDQSIATRPLCVLAELKIKDYRIIFNWNLLCKIYVLLFSKIFYYIVLEVKIKTFKKIKIHFSDCPLPHYCKQ